MNPLVIPALISAGASIFGSASSAKAQREANEASQNSVREQMEF